MPTRALLRTLLRDRARLAGLYLELNAKEWAYIGPASLNSFKCKLLDMGLARADSEVKNCVCFRSASKTLTG